MSKLCLATLAAAIVLQIAPVSAQTLPTRITDSKTLKIAVNGTYPPMESIDPTTSKLIGFDIDFGEAIAKSLGLKLEWQDGAFAQLIPSVQTGRADMILSGISDLPARRETLDFIDYLKSGAQFYTLDKTDTIKTADDLCGKTIGTVRSTSFPGNIEAWSAENCVKKGKPPITVAGSDRMPLVHIELQQGRIDAGVQGSETLPNLMKSSPGMYRIVTPPFTVVQQGIAFTKAETALRDAVAGAVKKIFADGTYTALITKWELQASAAPAPGMNGGPLP
jgi:polar amino acid transport system substrate-binding protein